VFSPYSSEQFEAILMLRMKDIEKQTGVKLNFQERSLRYISCKMYNAKGGDVRKVLIEVEKIVKSVL
jgi:Cdc6-like AAA superfamily ATPase